MITHPRVFDDEWPPRELHHREGAVETLSRAFDAATEGRPADNVIISGPSGVGKTALARHTLGRLDQHADIETGRIEGLGTTTGAVLRRAVDAAPGTANVAQNTPVETLREELRKRVERPMILVLDEAEGLPDTSALDPLVEVPALSIVVIVHDEDRWLARVSDTVRRAIDVSIHLDRYDVDELTEILRARADEGLAPSVVTDAQLDRISNEVAGVARFGIQSLHAAAQLATERDHWSIEDEDISDSFSRARRRIRVLNLRSLPLHHHVLYALLHDSGELTGQELHERYDAIADAVYRGSDLMPIGKRARRNKLQKLQDYDLVDRIPEGNTAYRVTDERVTPPIDIPDAEGRN